ncbi:hypothetical protein Plim_4173 [Planctopirus limnophila DSM 3776]|uniref:Intracellular proteinase inhibitor BsuPI domain-containing protein n=1 Tax=Planctopirus limnophila (strain ATCC 43296 / DSM 3776 / IFAM 1008 / Mu 290) TaxID=521674 RepID=D5SZ81_PLAL2|nr:hypothetical protein [Planctopirus limnophila]ADG69982.1 hypothetical protein Plim_4173 [Planctopirus limnophila DSM 3776]
MRMFVAMILLALIGSIRAQAQSNQVAAPAPEWIATENGYEIHIASPKRGREYLAGEPVKVTIHYRRTPQAKAIQGQWQHQLFRFTVKGENGTSIPHVALHDFLISNVWNPKLGIRDFEFADTFDPHLKAFTRTALLNERHDLTASGKYSVDIDCGTRIVNIPFTIVETRPAEETQPSESAVSWKTGNLDLEITGNIATSTGETETPPDFATRISIENKSAQPIQFKITSLQVVTAFPNGSLAYTPEKELHAVVKTRFGKSLKDEAGLTTILIPAKTTHRLTLPLGRIFDCSRPIAYRMILAGEYGIDGGRQDKRIASTCEFQWRLPVEKAELKREQLLLENYLNELKH